MGENFMSIIPNKLQKGDTIRIIAPSTSGSIVSENNKMLSAKRFAEMGLNVTFSKHINECDNFRSSSIESRIEDLHEAFADKSVKAILTMIGGFNSNQLLRYIDYDLIKQNPKIFCGYSDITALQNAIFAKTKLVTYSGPHFSTFAMEKNFDFTLNHFKNILFPENSSRNCESKIESLEIKPSEFWSDDAWYIDQNNRHFIPNSGYTVINEGSAEGTIIGGNLCTFNLLHGTEFMPSLKNSILFLEEDEMNGALTARNFDRDLQSIIHLPDFKEVRGMVIGRFQKKSEMTNEKIHTIISSKKELCNLPVIANVDFGHTDPMITFPIGDNVKILANNKDLRISFFTH